MCFFSYFESVQCFDAAGWVTGRAKILHKQSSQILALIWRDLDNRLFKQKVVLMMVSNYFIQNYLILLY